MYMNEKKFVAGNVEPFRCPRRVPCLQSLFHHRIAEGCRIASAHPRFDARLGRKSIYLSAWDEKASSATSQWRRSTCVARWVGWRG